MPYLEPCKKQKQIMESLGFTRTDYGDVCNVIWEINIDGKQIVTYSCAENEVPDFLTNPERMKLLHKAIYEKGKRNYRHQLRSFLGIGIE